MSRSIGTLAIISMIIQYNDNFIVYVNLQTTGKFNFQLFELYNKGYQYFKL